MTTVKTIISPKMIQWARERLGLDRDAFSKKMGVLPTKVLEWENGSSPITMTQAKKLSKVSLLHLGLFFLQDIPKLDIKLPNFRTVGGISISDASPELEATILSMQSKQGWFREYLEENKEDKLGFVGSVATDIPIKNAVEIIKKTLKIDKKLFDDPKSWEDLFNELIDLTEDSGILFVRNGIVGNNTRRPLDVEEFRGFVLIDEYAPLIFINGADSKNAQLFTFVHELVHVFVGESGLVHEGMMDRSSNPVERYCNQVAAEFLAPEDVIRESYNKKLSVEDNLIDLCRLLKISSFVVIYRLKELKMISPKEADRLIGIEKKAISQKKAKITGGGNFFESLKYRVGKTFAQSVISEALSNRISYRDAFKLLEVKNFEAMQKLAKTIGMPV